MHLAVGLFTIICAWKWGDWRNWQKYHATMLFFATGNLLYNVLYYDHWLWKYQSYFLRYHITSDLLSAFVILPLTALLFLTNYPTRIRDQWLRIIKYTILYFIFEVVYATYGALVYDYGWNVWYSLIWDALMFPLIALHYKKPLLSYMCSIVAVIAMLLLFPIVFK